MTHIVNGTGWTDAERLQSGAWILIAERVYRIVDEPKRVSGDDVVLNLEYFTEHGRATTVVQPWRFKQYRVVTVK